MRRWTYQLTSDDARAWLAETAPVPRRTRFLLGLTCFLIGALVALLPPALVGEWRSPRFILTLLASVATLLGAYALGRNLTLRRRARALIPAPRPASFEEWVDCIAVTEIDGEDDAYLSPELIGEVILTARHIVVKSHAQTLLIPTRAFATRSEAQELARYLGDLAKGPYYFDAQD